MNRIDYTTFFTFMQLFISPPLFLSYSARLSLPRSTSAAHPTPQKNACNLPPAVLTSPSPNEL